MVDLAQRVSSFRVLLQPDCLETRVARLEEALDIARTEYECLLVADEELRAQVDELALSDERLQTMRTKYAHLFDSAPDGYAIADGNGVVHECNLALASMLGLDATHIVGKPLAAFVVPADRGAFRSLVTNASAERPSFAEITLAPRAGDPMGAAVALSRFANGAATSSLFFRFAAVQEGRISAIPPPPDSDDLRAQNEVLARALADVRAENAAKDRMLAMTAHDLRGPLNAMLGWAQLLKRNGDDPDVRARAVDAIARNGNAQNALVGDLLDVSRAVAGTLSVELDPTAICDVVREVVEGAQPEAAHRGVRLEYRVPNVFPCVLADRKRLTQIVSNLVTNAIKFTPRTGVVAVSIEVEDAAASIVVQDSGKGLAPGAAERIFNPFQQDASPQAHEGLGLGLYIARELVACHGGTIGARSEGEGKGSAFWVRLPLADEVPELPSTDALAISVMRNLEGTRVLVVTDELDTAQLLFSVLIGQGADVVVARTLVIANATLDEAHPFNLAVVDLRLEGTIELVRGVRQRGANGLALLALGPEREAAQIDPILAEGVDAYLSIPLSVCDFVDAVDAASRLRQT